MTSIACVTMMKDETFFLPIWYRYYAGLFGAENVFLLDHASETPPAAILGPDLPLNVFRIPARAASSEAKLERTFDKQRFDLISGVVNGLLSYYDVVIFNDTDEIFVPDPARHSSLRSFVETRVAAGDVVAGLGVDLFQDQQSETAFDPARPLFAQRRNAVVAPHFSKPHILARPATITAHSVNGAFTLDPELYLVHLKYVDHARFLARQAARREADLKDDQIWAPWKWTEAQADRKMGARGKQRQAGRDLSGRDVCRKLFGRDGPVRFGAPDSPELTREPIEDRVRVLDYVSAFDERRIRKTRRTLPACFAETGI